MITFRSSSSSHPPLTNRDGITFLWTPTCQRFQNTRKYQSECMARPSVVYPLLLTGLGGSGTHAVTQQLRDHGMDVGHEELETHGSVVRTNTISIEIISYSCFYSSFLCLQLPMMLTTVMVLCGERCSCSYRLSTSCQTINTNISHTTICTSVPSGSMSYGTDISIYYSFECIIRFCPETYVTTNQTTTETATAVIQKNTARSPTEK